jgi:hypoxanthine-guanine phosphoribosyltransferase
LTEPSPNVAEDSSLRGILLVEDVGEGGKGRTEAVEEVLGKDPAGVGVGSLLDGELRVAVEERVGGENIWERRVRTGGRGS